MYSLGYDIGSSSVKAALVRLADGQTVAQVKYPDDEMPISAPESGWAEQDPEYWWTCVVAATQRLFTTAAIDASNVTSIGIGYQMHGLVVVDKQQQVLRPSIIWCDGRAVGVGEQALEKIGRKRSLQTLLNYPGNFTASKLRWVQENQPELYEKVDQIMLPGDYIAMKLSGKTTTTIGGLSEGIFWDFSKQQIAEDILSTYAIDKDLLSEIVPIIGLQCEVNETAAAALGIPKGTPVSYRAGDQPNNALALNVLQPGEVAATGGTSGVVYGVTQDLLYDEHSRVNAFAHVNYTAETPNIGILMCINGSGIQYSWLKHQMVGNQLDYPELEKLAATVAVGANGLSILPFGNGAERILQNKHIGAHISGIDFNRHQQAHIVRATLEGMAFAFVYGMDLLKKMGLPMEVIRVGNDNLFQSEIFANTIALLSGCEIEMLETTGAVGAARAAAVGAGHWPSLEDAPGQLRQIKVYSPQEDSAAYQQAYDRWLEELKERLKK